MGPRKLNAGRVPNSRKTNGNWSREGRRRAVARLRKEEERDADTTTRVNRT